MPLKALLRPEYALRPSQLWRRLRRDAMCRQDAVRLAWGLPVAITRRTHVGEEIVNHGVSDKIVPEVIWRLLDSGEDAVDAGANLGQNTSIMALRSGGGRIHAFEPHPGLYAMLRENVRRWETSGVTGIHAIATAVSSSLRTATLYECTDLGGNSLELHPPNPSKPLVPRSFEVECTTLDHHLSGTSVALVKIDVEGHEIEVLRGGRQALTETACRDVLFEDFAQQPSPLSRLLMEYGFEVFGLYTAWRGPVLVPLPALERKGPDYTSNFLATRDPKRAIERLEPRGWQCLRTLVRVPS